MTVAGDEKFFNRPMIAYSLITQLLYVREPTT